MKYQDINKRKEEKVIATPTDTAAGTNANVGGVWLTPPPAGTVSTANTPTNLVDTKREVEAGPEEVAGKPVERTPVVANPVTTTGQEDAGPEGWVDSPWQRNYVQAQTETTPATTEQTSSYTPGTDIYDWMRTTYSDPEEEARIERANKTKLGIIALGDAIRHFGNIYHTSKYAPSQTLTNATKEEYARQQADDALRQQQQYKNAVLRQQQQKQMADLYYKQQDALRKDKEYELKQQQAEARNKYYDISGKRIQAQTEDIAKERELKQQQFEHKKKMEEGKLNLQKANTQSMIQHRRAMESIARSREARQRMAAAARSGKGGHVGSSKDTDYILTSNGNFLAVPKSLKTGENASTIFSQLPKTMQRKSRANTEAEKWRFIADNATNPAVAKLLGKMGATIIDDGSSSKKGGFYSSLWNSANDTMSGLTQLYSGATPQSIPDEEEEEEENIYDDEDYNLLEDTTFLSNDFYDENE